jgi:hypothetical protein
MNGFVTALAGLLLCGNVIAAQGDPPHLDVLLARAAAYLTAYETAFAGTVSEEHYVQSLRDTNASVFTTLQWKRRALSSDIVAAPDPVHAWMSFRDVFAVDGVNVRDRDERLQELFLAPKADPFGQARRIADEGALFNLGRIARNVNFPTLPLTFLADENQSRSEFKREGTSTINGVHVVEVSFKEKGRPTIVRSGAADLPVSGRFWLEPDSGRVMKAAVTYDSRTFSGKVTVTFAFAEKLKLWMPAEMDDVMTSGIETVTGHATYDNFRRFGVTTDVIIK